MQALELKVPPPLVAALIAASMWGISKLPPAIALPEVIRTVTALPVALAGAALTGAGLLSFRQARTTVNPMKPQSAALLVRSGVYSISRNPMYLGLLVVLVAWAAFLSTVWALLGPLVYVLYINRFQIAPEERILSAKFGASYAEYKARVRQWI
jgi:protein-S-isoprenylcysteine O-methyltransferase Ste14